MQSFNACVTVESKQLPVTETGTQKKHGPQTIVSRRTTRVFFEQAVVEAENLGGADMKTIVIEKDQEKAAIAFKHQSKSLARENAEEMSSILPMVDFGMTLYGMFPHTEEELKEEVAKSLRAAQRDKTRGEGRPINFGTVLPGAIYRSSFPMVEDFQFLGTLGLKTVISLVDRGFLPEFKSFMATHGIHHHVVDMQGTKKVEIPDIMMQQIMQLALDHTNHPMLIHCNHGKHRTGCVIGVIRLLSGWDVDSVVEEYEGFARPKARDCDVKYITKYRVSSLSSLSHRNHPRSVAALKTWRMLRYCLCTVLVLIAWIATAMYWGQYH